MRTRLQAAKLAMGVSAVAVVLMVSGTAETARAGHRTAGRSVSTAPGATVGYVRSYYGPVRRSGVGTASAYGFTRSHRVVRPVHHRQRYVPVTNYSYGYSPYGYSSYGYSNHNYCSPSLGISYHRPGFSIGFSRGGHRSGISVGIFGR